MKRWFVISIIIAILLSIIVALGIYWYNKKGEDQVEKYMGQVEKEIKEKEEAQNKLESNRIDILAVNGEEEKTTPNTEIKKGIYYIKCGHTITEKEKIEIDLVNLKQEEFAKKKVGWKVINFSSQKIELYKEEEGICKEHYILREKDGFIAIYQLDEKEKETLVEMTSIVTQYLPEMDKERLQEGIRANGKVALNRILEDYE